MTRKYNRVKTIKGIKVVKNLLPLLFGLVSIFCLTVTSSIAIETSISNISVADDTVRLTWDVSVLAAMKRSHSQFTGMGQMTPVSR